MWAIFAFVDATLIKPLPYKDPSRLVGVFERVPIVCPIEPVLRRLPRLENTEQGLQLALCVTREAG